MRRTADGWWIAVRTQLLTGNDSGFDVAINRFERRKVERETDLA